MGMNSPPHLLRWDPRAQAIEDLGLALQGADCVYSVAVSTSGDIVGGGCEKAKAFRFDPAASRLTDYGWLGPQRQGQSYVYSVGGDATHLYGASGKMPWIVVALEKATGRQHELLRFEPQDFPAIHQRRDGVHLRVLVKSKGEPHYLNYRLVSGRAIHVKDGPAKGEEHSPFREPLPRVLLDASIAPTEGRVRLWYETGEQQAPPSVAPPQVPGWRQVSFDAPAAPLTIGRLLSLRDGTLLGHARPYGPLFQYDPRTGTHRTLGEFPDVNVYAFLQARDGLVYFSGYPSASLNVYDPRRPWTSHVVKPGAPAPKDDAPESNPRRLLYFSTLFGVHTGMHLAEGADGRIFVCAEGRRHRVGGALGWYDPAKGTAGGISEPRLAQLDCAWMASTNNGESIVYSSRITPDANRPNETPAEAVLLAYDVRTGRTAEIRPMPGVKDTGPIAEGRPGTIVGAACIDGGSRLYLVDLKAASIVRSRDVAASVGGESRDGPDFQKGRDGFIWTFVSGLLSRIDPATLEAEPVVSIPQPERFSFLGSDVYLAGLPHLRRLSGVNTLAPPGHKPDP